MTTEVSFLLQMKYFKNLKLVIPGALLILAGTGSIVFGLTHKSPSSREINRVELEQFLQANTITDGRVTPTPYAGIYYMEGTHKAGPKSEKVYITTHLDEAQIKTLLGQNTTKVEMP